MTKAEKLISRGSEKPEVTRAAKTISDMLCRLSLGQAQYFAESVEGAFPDLTQTEAAALARCLERAADYFQQKADGEQFPHCGYAHDPVRTWKTNEEFFYDIHKLFCVLACNLEYCGENQDCWETRSAFCRDYTPKERSHDSIH